MTKKRRGKMQRGKTPKKVEELSRRRCLLLISPLTPSPLRTRAALRGSRCIIHDFVNVACRCIFTALYLEKFRAGETRYTAASARGLVSGKGHACPVYPRAKGALSNSIRHRISGCPTREDRGGWDGSCGRYILLVTQKQIMSLTIHWTQIKGKV